MEEREQKAAQKATELISSFQGAFLQMSYTLHPSGIPGEAPGKSSNENWAAQYIFEHYRQFPRRKDILMTIMDGNKLFVRVCRLR
jgi:hypothetical protein